MNLKKTVYEQRTNQNSPSSRPQQGEVRKIRDMTKLRGGGMLIVHVGYRGPGTVGHAPPCTEGPSS